MLQEDFQVITFKYQQTPKAAPSAHNVLPTDPSAAVWPRGLASQSPTPALTQSTHLQRSLQLLLKFNHAGGCSKWQQIRKKTQHMCLRRACACWQPRLAGQQAGFSGHGKGITALLCSLGQNLHRPGPRPGSPAGTLNPKPCEPRCPLGFFHIHPLKHQQHYRKVLCWALRQRYVPEIQDSLLWNRARFLTIVELLWMKFFK